MQFSTSPEDLEAELPSLFELYQIHKHIPGVIPHGSDKGTTHTYITEYERLLKPYRQKSTVLEIGILAGYSLQLWQDYFMDSEIIGVDINIGLALQHFPQRKFQLIQGDATQPAILDQLGDRTFDVVIDDGSHALEDQRRTFEILKGRMNQGGLFVIEDVIDIDQDRHALLSLHDNCEIIDNRSQNGRYDDVLVLYRF